MGPGLNEYGILQITELSFKIKAIKEDTHDVYVQCGNSVKENGMVGDGTLLKDQVENPTITMSYTFQVPRDDDGNFYVQINVSAVVSSGSQVIGAITVPIIT
jgi:hypothetical protein